MNHCMLEVEVIKAPTIRYTQDNKTPIAEMEVLFNGLRIDDEPGQLKVIGWGNLAQDMQSRIKTGQKLVLEGRLRMNTIPRQDGTKEKQAEFTLSKLHPLSEKSPTSPLPSTPDNSSQSASQESRDSPITGEVRSTELQEASWNSSPLIPDTDEIPF